MSDFTSAMIAAGLRPRDIVADGRWRRCATDTHPRKRNGAYKLDIGGKRGWYRDWAAHEAPIQWGDGNPATPTDRRHADFVRAMDRERRAQGIRDARAIWADGLPYRGHPYINGKGLLASGCHQLRTWYGKVWTDDGASEGVWLLAPMYWRDRLINVQRISPSGTKRQVKGAPQRAASLILGRARWSLTVLAEGLATGLAIYQCMPLARVVVCYNAANLLPVVQELRPTGSVVIAADNDHETAAKPHMHGVNPGIEAAKNAARLIDCGVVWPEGIDGTDFADALKEWGDRGPKRVERIINAGARYVASG